MTKIYILHENKEWFVPLGEELDKLGVPYEEWEVIQGCTDLDSAPPEGIFFNRLSASSHTRDHRYAIEYGETILAWLESHGRCVVNGRHTLSFETRKFDQYAKLSALGINVPKTIAAVGESALVEAAINLGETPFIVKPNRGGKGLGVKLYQSVGLLKKAIDNGDIDDSRSLDGVFLVQNYVASKEPRIIRAEFIGGKFHYAVQVDTSEGFELCPADSCSIEEAQPASNEFCMTDNAGEKFVILEGYNHPNIKLYEDFLQKHNIDVAAIESIEAIDGVRYTYDINVNTNYNKSAEESCNIQNPAYARLARYLTDQLQNSCSLAA